MARSRATVARWQKAAKVKALSDDAGTPGEQQAAEAALERIGATPKAPAHTQREPFTDASVKQLPTPETASKIYYDGTVPGFGVRVTAAGSRAYVLNYRVRGTGRERRYTIGDCANWTIGQARKKARDLRHEIDDGADPLGDLQDERAAPTVAALIDRFVEEHVKPRLRPGTRRAYRTLLSKYIGPHFGKHTKVADVEFADIDALHRKITRLGNPYAANRCVGVLSKMFALAARWNMRADNPARGIERNHEGQRKRYLSSDELARLTQALSAHPDKQVVNILRLLLLTGARRGEVFSMRWGDISQSTERGSDGDVVHKTVWSKAASMTKQKQDHTVPLSAPAAKLLDEIKTAQSSKRQPLGEYVFPSLGNSGHVVSIEKAWRTICRTAQIEGLRIHDLRHSVASFLVSGGASLPLIAAILGHSNSATSARYSHLFMSPQEAAVERIGAIIEAAGKPAEAPVPFPGGRRGG